METLCQNQHISKIQPPLRSEDSADQKQQTPSAQQPEKTGSLAGGRVYQCRKCAVSVIPTEAQKRRNSYICKECQRMVNIANRIRAAARGYIRKPTSPQWQKEYRARPEIMEQSRLQAQKYKANNRCKTRARDTVKRAIKNGIIIRGACSICGKENAEAHHEDYSKPLEVIWLCKKHHAERHKNETKSQRL